MGRAGNVAAAMRRTSLSATLLGCVMLASLPVLAGCAHVAAPASAPPTADAALARMHATFACANAVQANAKIDHFGEHGRVRGDLMLFAARPARLRMDVVSPFGVALATLTSDGRRFGAGRPARQDVLHGPAEACNIARLTHGAGPGPRAGRSPPRRGAGAQARGRRRRRSPGTPTAGGRSPSRARARRARRSTSRPRPDDWAKPWAEQRMRVLDVRVVQQGYVLYHAELSDHAARADGRAARGSRTEPRAAHPAERPGVRRRGPAQDPRRGARCPRPTSASSTTQIHLEPAAAGGHLRRSPSPPGMRVEPVTCRVTARARQHGAAARR